MLCSLIPYVNNLPQVFTSLPPSIPTPALVPQSTGKIRSYQLKQGWIMGRANGASAPGSLTVRGLQTPGNIYRSMKSTWTCASITTVWNKWRNKKCYLFSALLIAALMLYNCCHFCMQRIKHKTDLECNCATKTHFWGNFDIVIASEHYIS